MEIENLKKAFYFIRCGNRRNSLDEYRGEKSRVDISVPHESSTTVTPHSRRKALSYVVGVDSIDVLVSDFDNSVCHMSSCLLFTNTTSNCPITMYNNTLK